VAPLPMQEKPRPITSWLYPSLILASFLLGILSGYAAWGRRSQSAAAVQPPAASADTSSESGSSGMDFAALMKQVNPQEGYELPVRYGDLGPRLLESGAINYDAFAAVYENAGDPLTQFQVEALKRGSDEQIVISAQNAHFLLNFFWAVGLVNKNQILTEGAMVQNSGGQIERFASTGGWTLGTKPVTELYASTELILLTPEQQARVEEVAAAVYRPCCNNPTIFPDCNHGMAMLGLLQLLAAQDASVDEMFTAAKYVNAFWFSQQSLQTAIYLKANQNIDFAQADPRMVTGQQFFSASGSAQVYASLQSSGLLPKAPDSGGSCGT
ncbi:MAG: hypothetical protein Q8O48_07570, partial [Anaerolineales bacterium]|nr:hypothetical protein [Anaerolineales bacterium]